MRRHKKILMPCGKRDLYINLQAAATSSQQQGCQERSQR